MRAFSYSDLTERSRDVFDAAKEEPVSVVEQGEAKVVMLPASEYRRLVDRAGRRTAYSLDDAPDEDIAILTEAFEKIAANGDPAPS